MILKEAVMDESVKELICELGCALNETVVGSKEIADAVAKIREAGYDVTLVIEATIAIKRSDAEEENREETEDGTDTETSEEVAEQNRLLHEEGVIRFTSGDDKFLRDLRISTEDL